MDSNEQPGQAGPIRRMITVIWNLVQAAILLYGIGVTGYLVARVTIGERWGMVAFANNFLPWWALGGVVLAGIALLSQYRLLLVALQVPGVIAFLVLYGGVWLPRDPVESAPDGPHLTAATYNVLSVGSDPARVIAVIRALEADIVALQELGPEHAARMEAELSDRYPYQAHDPALPVQGVGLLSRYPIQQTETFMPQPHTMRFLRAVVDVAGTPLTVYVAHPSPPSAAFSPLTYSDDQRDTQLAILRERYLQHETGPLLVMGDFNMSDQSDAYRAMDRMLDDAFRVAGRGLGFTFPGKPVLPLLPRVLRIDYIWYNDDLIALDARAAPKSGTSDHLPVVARLALRNSHAVHTDARREPAP
jgi:vancomycin resistance protein VanJ